MATREEIEAQISASPTDDAAFLILGDLLQLEGDPRGELIALDAAAATKERGGWNARRAKLFEQHPDLAPIIPSGAQFEWHLGFVRRVTLTSHVPLGIFDDPALRFVTELVFVDPEAGRFVGFFAEALQRVPHLRSLAIGDPTARHYHWPRERTTFDLPTLVDQLPQLERIYACEAVEVGAAPRLRKLRLEGDPQVFARLQTAWFPALEKLAVRDGITRETTVFDRLAWLFERPPPKLADLELTGAEGNELLQALIGTPLLKQLRALRLWNAGITAAGARAITRESFGHLELLDLSDPLLDDATIAAVSGIAREVRTISPWMREILRRPG